MNQVTVTVAIANLLNMIITKYLDLFVKDTDFQKDLNDNADVLNQVVNILQQ